jgi:hypothetical protein
VPILRQPLTFADKFPDSFAPFLAVNERAVSVPGEGVGVPEIRTVEIS